MINNSKFLSKANQQIINDKTNHIGYLYVAVLHTVRQ